MTKSPIKGTILYFEDDDQVSKMIVDFLTGQNFQLIHYSQFPAQGLIDIKARLEQLPDIVIIDIIMPGMNGYEVCKQLRENYLGEEVPILFLSGQIETDDILKAYDVGANDFLAKPIRLQELLIKLELYLKLKKDKLQLDEQANSARQMAFEAMTTSSELGEILRFHEESYKAKTLEELARLLFKAIKSFGLSSSLVFFGEKNHYFSDDEANKPLEEKILLAFRGKERIYSWEKRTFFNYINFSVLIRNMPIEDEVRYGVLKDQLCLLFNGVDVRVNSMNVEKINERKTMTLKITADTIANMVMEMENEKVGLSEKFEKIIMDMETNISSDIIQFNLLEHEEKTLMDHIVLAIKQSSAIFETSLEKEKQYKDVMTRLLEKL